MATTFFRNVLSGGSLKQLGELRAACTLEAHVLGLQHALEQRGFSGGVVNLSRFAACARVDAVHVEQLQGSQVLLERIEKYVTFWPKPQDEDQQLTLRFRYTLERSVMPAILDLNDWEARCEVPGREAEGEVFRVTDSTSETHGLQCVEELLEKWEEHATALGDENPGRDLRWFMSFMLTHPSDHAFDTVSQVLMQEGEIQLTSKFSPSEH
mmetsp:Transcript_6421/g.17432  ORF Transcript_6421/g.17432 Transcript_6421/m.17432 type:complete len:211 (+) Transcript_6421:17-649(+)|eukprot:CAMPEP_0185187480 /NCGR_PEP_ID=MMETSP1140-20130426/4768_1 /TAXON_ID=298111 /ORGANISM="Pavlova sp., Strain CCMP459" /LENGTH=210 /DNA_ID=CAMNT_0027753881 /DNA_START=14 /DNA_END=646 /DNA_ORIENTATION=-